jgi:hypothetical protein
MTRMRIEGEVVRWLWSTNRICVTSLAELNHQFEDFRVLPCHSVAEYLAARVRGAADHLAKRDGYYMRWLLHEMAT